MIPSSIKRLVLTLIFALSAIGLAQPQPQPTVGGTLSATELLGKSVTLNATFANTSTDIGYGPYIQFILPSNFGGVASGITFGSADYEGLFTIDEIARGPALAAGNIPHPYSSGGTEIFLNQGDTLYVIPLPFGSYTNAQGEANVEITFNIAQNAIPEQHDFQIQGGFRYGNTATGTNGPVIGTAVGAAVTPRVIDGLKHFSYYDNNRAETAIGPSYIRTFTLEAEIAPGQEVSNLVFTDILPNDVVVLGNFRITGTDATLASVTIGPDNTDITGQNWNPGEEEDWPKPAGTEMNITIGGTPSDVVTVSYDVYYPFLSEAGDPVRGTSQNSLEIGAIWSHNTDSNWQGITVGDGRVGEGEAAITETVHLENNQETNELEHSSSLKIQKFVKKTSGTPDADFGQGAREVVPGDVFDFELRMQISDMSAYDSFRIRDVLSDGLAFNTGSLDITANYRNQTVGASGQIEPGWLPDATTGEQTMIIPLSTLLSNNGVTGGRLLGACVNPDGTLIGDFNQCATQTTEVVISYSARVLNEYRSNDHQISLAEKKLLQGDHLRNDVAVDAQALQHDGTEFIAAGTQAGEFEDDTSFATFNLANSEPSKSVLKVNEDDFVQETTIVQAGDLVTFELEVELPTGNVGEFTLVDHLPYPVFDVDGDLFSVQTDANAPYAANEVRYTKIPDAWTAAQHVVPTASGNALTFDFGTIQADDNYVGGTLTIELTVQVVDQAMADELLLTNQLQVTEADNRQVNNLTTSLALTQFKYGRPVLNITNGVVAVGGSTSLGQPGWADYATGVTGTFDNPPVITSDTNRNDFTADQPGVDGYDHVTFLAVIENTGSGPRGAFDVTTTITVPNGLTMLGFDSDIQVYRGNSTTALDPSNYTITNFLATGFTIEFNDPVGGTSGFLGQDATDGSNIVSILYKTLVDYNIPALSRDDYTVVAEITDYRAIDGAVSENLADTTPDADKIAGAFVNLYNPTPVKTVTAITPDLGGSDVYASIGSTVTYQIEVTLPEGQYDRLVIHDNLPTGLGYIPGTARIVVSSANNVTAGQALTVGTSRNATTGEVTADPRTTTWNSGQDVHIDFGSVLVNNNDEAVNAVTLELQARVLHEPTSSSGSQVNSHGNQRGNTAGVYAQAGIEHRSPQSSAANVRIVEPNLTIIKSNDAPGNIEAGDVFTYTIAVSNPKRGTYETPPIHNLEVRDVLPPELQFIGPITKFETGGPTAVPNGSFDGTGAIEAPTALIGTIDKINTNEFVRFTFDVRVLSTIHSYQELENTAEVQGDSQHLTDVNDRLTNIWDQNRVYTASNTDTIKAKEINPTKEIADTSEGFTGIVGGVEQVAIGEVITYRLTAALPLGQSNEIRFVDQLHEDLAYVGNPRYYIAAPGTGTVGSSVGLVITNDALNASSTWTSLGAGAVSHNGNEVTFTFGDIDNGSDEAVTIYLDFDVVVKASAMEKRGSTITNSFVVHTNDGTSEHETPSTEVDAQVVTPDITVLKTAAITAADSDAENLADGNVRYADLAETVTYTVTITNPQNTDNTVTSGWGLAFSDTLPAGVTYVSGTATVASSTFAGIPASTSVNYDGGTRTLSIVAPLDGADQHQFETSNQIVITYQAEIDNNLNAGDVITNTATASTSSLPDDADTGDDVIFTHEDTSTVTLGTPALTIAKSMTEESFNGYDTFELEAQVVITNSGNLRVDTLSLVEDLATAFTFGTDVILHSIDAVTVDTVDADNNSVNRGLVVHGDFLDTNIASWEVFDAPLPPEDGIILVGDVVTVTIDFTVKATEVAQLIDTNNSLVNYTNTVNANAESIGGLKAIEATNTAVLPLTYVPGLSVTKTASPTIPVEPNADGTYTVTYTFNVENTGNVHLPDFTLVDEFVDALDGNFSVVSPIVLDNLSVPAPAGIVLNNGDYDGDTDTSLLSSAAQELQAGESFSFDMTVTLQPEEDMSGVSGNHVVNTVIGTGTTLDETISDDDDVAVNFDIPEPTFDLAKTAANVTFDGVSVYTVNFGITATNTSGVQIDSFNITEDLEAALGTFPADIAVSNLVANIITPTPATSVTTSADFQGHGAGQEILIFDAPAGIELQADAVLEITFTATFSLTAVPDWESVTNGNFNFTNEISATAQTIIGGTYTEEAEADFVLRYNPTLDASKGVDTFTHHANGSHAVTFDIEFANTGNVDLQNFQITDNLATVLGTNNFRAQVTVGAASDVLEADFVTSLTGGTTYTSTSPFDGIFLNPAIALKAGQTVVFQLQITEYTPNNWDTVTSTYLELTNTVTGDAEHGPAGPATRQPITESADASFTPAEAPRITVIKTASPLAPANDAGYDIDFFITVTNLGDVDLHDLSVIEDLGAALGTTAFDISTVTFNPIGISPNSDWNGTTTNVELIAPNQTLASGTGLTITIQLTGVQIPDNVVNTGENTLVDPRTNTVEVSGVAPITRTVEADDTATFTPVDNAEISVVKQAVVQPVSGLVDTFDIFLVFDIANKGPVTLNNVELIDDLRTLPTGTTGTPLGDIVDLTSADYTHVITDGYWEYNTNYQNGSYDILADNQSLAPGLQRSITIKIAGAQLISSTATSAVNQAVAKGTAHGRKVTDLSDVSSDTGDTPTPIELNSPVLDKSFVVTGGTTHDEQEVNIGDVVRYSLSATFEPNTYNNLAFSDVLPTGMELEGTVTYNLTNAGAPVVAGGTLQSLEETIISTLVVAPGRVAQLEITFDALVTNHSDLDAGHLLPNSFGLTYDYLGSETRLQSNTVTARVVEPKPEIEKTITSATGSVTEIAPDNKSVNHVDIGDTVTFVLTVTNTGTNAGDGYGLQITDMLPSELVFQQGSAVAGKAPVGNPTQHTPIATNTFAGGVTFDFGSAFEFAVGDTVFVTYNVVIANQPTVVAGASFTNVVHATLYSQTDQTDANIRSTDSSTSNSTVHIVEPTVLVSKELVSSQYDGATGFDVQYKIYALNNGPIDLGHVAIVEDLTATFPDGVISDINITPAATGWTGNAAFDGTSGELLDNPAPLVQGVPESLTLSFNVSFTDFDDFDGVTFENIVVATPTSPGGVDGPDDESEDGDTPSTPINPDDPNKPEDPTPVTFDINPSLEVVKTVTSLDNNADGSYDTTFTITVANTGDADLRGLQVVDNLDDAFAVSTKATTYSIVSPITVVHSEDGDMSAAVGAIPTITNGWQLLDNANTVVLRAANSTATPQVVAEDLTITFTVRFNPPKESPFVYNNIASASAITQFEDGPDVTGSDDVDFIVEEIALIGVSTSYDNNPLDEGNGSYIIDLTVYIENYGVYGTDEGVELSNIQALFDLDDFFADAAYFEYIPNSLTSNRPSIEVNDSFNGIADTRLLNPTDTGVLQAKGQPSADPNDVELTFQVRVIPGGKLDYLVNSPVTALTPLDLPVEDDSNDGGNPDVGGGITADPAGADNDGDPTNNTAPTPIVFPDEPLIGLAKAFDQTSLSGTGTPGEFNLTFTFSVQNYGNAQLNNVGIVDDFDNIFDDGSAWAVTDIRVIDGSIAPALATHYPTKSNPNGYQLLDTSSSVLASVAQANVSGAVLTSEATIEVDMVVTPNTPGREYQNTAVANGTSPGNTPTTDTSQDGTDPDPDGNEDPTDNDDPTPFRFERPDIEVTKDATSSIRPDGQMDVHYTFTIQNTGDVDLHDVQLTDNLAAAFGADNYALMSLFSTTLTVKPLAPMVGGYDGNNVTELLTGTDTIATGAWYAEPIVPGAEHTVHLHIVVKNPDVAGTINTATASGVSPALNSVDDDSTFTVFPNEDPRIALAKTATTELLADGTFNVDYRFIVKNVGDVQLSNVQITDDLQDLYASTDLTASKITRVYSELTYNTNFTGNTDSNLLTGVDTLEVGQEKTIIIRLNGVTATQAGTIENTATASGTGPYGGTTDDKSNDGLTPQPDEDVPTVIDLTPVTQIALAKHGASSLRADGNYDVTFTLNVANVGNSKLLGVQVRDTLSDFYAKTNINAGMITVTSARFAVNPAFDGANDSDLLLGTDILEVGEQDSITITIIGLVPNAGVTAVNNTAIASARDAAGNRTTDVSNNGVTPDPTDDTETPTTLTPAPQIGIAKSADVTLVDGATYTAVFELVLKNYGNTNIHNVQVTDDLTDFYTDASLAAGNINVTATGLTVNAGFDGQGNQNLLTGTDTLNIGETKTITITLSGMVITAPLPHTIHNVAIATGTDPSGNTPTEDESTDGDDPDPDGNDDPTDNDDPTPVEFDANPLFGLAKDATVELGTNVGFKLTFVITAQNYGNTDIVNLQIEDDMMVDLLNRADAYATPVATSTDFTVNATFNGDTDIEVLAGTDTLPVNGSGTVTIVVDDFVPNPQYSRGSNQATGIGIPPGGDPNNPETDESTPGDDPDPDGNDDPTDNDDPTPVEFHVTPPVVGLAKAATTTLHNDGTFDVTLLFTVENFSAVPANNIQIRDDLTDLYDQTNLAPTHITVSSPAFPVNANYDGATDVYLLNGPNTLAAYSTETVTISIVGITASNNEVEVFNTAIVSGEDPRTGRPIVPDESTDGDDPDPDGDDDPHNNRTPTPITLHIAPKIGLAKEATVTAKGGGVHDITFTIRAVNYGDTNLTNVQIADSLDEFYTRTTLTANDVTVTSADLTPNVMYDGRTNLNLLSGTDTLPVGATATVTITLSDVIPAADVTRLYNSAFVDADTPSGGKVNDTSHNGPNPDPTGGNNPGNYNTPTPVDFTPTSGVLLEKRAEKGEYEIGNAITYTITVSNPHSVAITFTLEDTIPSNTTYIADTTAFSDDAFIPLDGKEPRRKDATTLEWRSIVLPAGEVLNITYDLRILPGASGSLTNVVGVYGEDEDYKKFTSSATSTVKVVQGIFDREKSILTGRVFIDTNNNSLYDEGVDIPIENARLVLSNGWQTTTDGQGNYAFRNIDSGTWSVQLDERTAPYPTQRHPEQLRDLYQHRVSVNGHTVSDFPLIGVIGDIVTDRETFVTFGPVTLHKYLLDGDANDVVVLDISTTEELPATLLLTDPLPDGGERTYVADPTPGAITTYTYDLPNGSQLTDPILEWSDQQ